MTPSGELAVPDGRRRQFLTCESTTNDSPMQTEISGAAEAELVLCITAPVAAGASEGWGLPSWASCGRDLAVNVGASVPWEAPKGQGSGLST